MQELGFAVLAILGLSVSCRVAHGTEQGEQDRRAGAADRGPDRAAAPGHDATIARRACVASRQRGSGRDATARSHQGPPPRALGRRQHRTFATAVRSHHAGARAADSSRCRRHTHSPRRTSPGSLPGTAPTLARRRQGLATDRQPDGQARSRDPLHRHRLPAQVCRRDLHHSDRAAPGRRGPGRSWAAGLGMAPAPDAQGARTTDPGHGDRHFDAGGLQCLPTLRADTFRSCVRTAGVPHDIHLPAGGPAGSALARGIRHHGWLRIARAAGQRRRRQPCCTLRLLRAAQCRCVRPGLHAFMASAQSAGIHLHFHYRRGLGRTALHPGPLLVGASIPDPVLPVLRRDSACVRDQGENAHEGLRRHHAGPGHAAAGIRVPGRPGQGHAVRPCLYRAWPGRILSRPRHRIMAQRARTLTPDGRDLRRGRRHLRHARRAVCPRCALDIGRMGARRRRVRVVRSAQPAPACLDIRAAAAGGRLGEFHCRRIQAHRGHGARCQCMAGIPAARRQRVHHRDRAAQACRR